MGKQEDQDQITKIGCFQPKNNFKEEDLPQKVQDP